MLEQDERRFVTDFAVTLSLTELNVCDDADAEVVVAAAVDADVSFGDAVLLVKYDTSRSTVPLIPSTVPCCVYCHMLNVPVYEQTDESEYALPGYCAIQTPKDASDDMLNAFLVPDTAL